MPENDLMVVIPAYNEARVLGEVVRGLREVAPRITVVDDGSRDETTVIARKTGATVLRHPVNRGQGAALQTGLRYAVASGVDFVVTFDADDQHRPEDVEALVAPLRSGEVDVVLGSRFLASAEEVQKIPRLRRWLLRAAILFTRWTSGLRVTDTHNGLRAFNRRAAVRIHISADRMAHASEILDQIHRLGLRYREVPVRVRYTEYSRAKGQKTSSAIRILMEYFWQKILD